jgi:hypothetical protein
VWFWFRNFLGGLAERMKGISEPPQECPESEVRFTWQPSLCELRIRKDTRNL